MSNSKAAQMSISCAVSSIRRGYVLAHYFLRSTLLESCGVQSFNARCSIVPVPLGLGQA